MGNESRRRPRQSQDWSDRVTVVACVMSVEPPIHQKRRGKPDLWVATWRVMCPPDKGDDSGTPFSCEIKFWDSCARDFGDAARKGDVVILEGT